MADGFRVNFLIVGTQKGGTTALASFLSGHPEICMSPKKEAHFFNSEGYARCADDGAIAAAYRKFFPNFTGQPHVGEATPLYMFIPGIAEKIHRYNPAMKLICVLRNPVERATSHYAMEKSRGRETLPLPLALLAEPWRMRGWQHEKFPSPATRQHSYLSRGFYSRQLGNLQRHFPASQIHVLTSDDLWSRHGETLKSIYRFLGVTDQTFIPSQQRVFAGDTKTAVPPGLRPLLNLIYRNEISRLEKWLGRKLPEWK